MDDQAASDPATARHADIAGSQGFQVGDHNIQVNFLFSGRQAAGPVVAGKVPQAPSAFQAREDLMAQLRVAGSGVSVVQAVTGMRGVGKTQLAAAYARECQDAGWRLVGWVSAEDVGSVLSGLAVIGDRLGVDGAQPLEAIGGEVRNRLEADGERCLVVFDNVADFRAIDPYVPAMGNARVVITSTETAIPVRPRPITVGVFSEGEALAFLAERTGCSDPDGARVLARELGRHPLALAQAAAVIAGQRLTYGVYLERLRAFPAERYLPPARDDPYPHGVAEAILMSVYAALGIDRTGLCGPLLAIISLLSQDGVARALLHHGESAEILAAGAEVIDEALGHLARTSLLLFSDDGSAVIAHRLVMRVVRDSIAHAGDLADVGTKTCWLLHGYVRSLGEAWRNPAAARDFVRQAATLNEHTAPLPLGEVTVAELLALRGWALGHVLELRDSHDDAVELGEQLVDDCERLLGDAHRETIKSYELLADALEDAGWGEEAIPLRERVLARKEAADDRDGMLTAKNNLAHTYRSVGRLDAAISLFEQVVAESGEARGEADAGTLMSRHNLARAYQDAGRTAEAITLLEDVLAQRQVVLGDEHKHTISTRDDLAFAYRVAGRHDEAVPLYERVLADAERVMGVDYADTLACRNNLAGAYQDVGRHDEAITLYEQVLTVVEHARGPEHPDAVMVRYNLEEARKSAVHGGAAPSA